MLEFLFVFIFLIWTLFKWSILDALFWLRYNRGLNLRFFGVGSQLKWKTWSLVCISQVRVRTTSTVWAKLNLVWLLLSENHFLNFVVTLIRFLFIWINGFNFIWSIQVKAPIVLAILHYVLEGWVGLWLNKLKWCSSNLAERLLFDQLQEWWLGVEFL